MSGRSTTATTSSTPKPDGSALTRLTEAPGYDAEATVCGVDGSILFTSVRDGDIELYRMDADGGNVKRLTHTPGYDGGAFFSADCSQIVWRASRPKVGKELDDFQGLLKQGLVRPSKLEIYVANADGSNARQITYLDAASFAPFFFPDGKRVLFSTNYQSPGGRDFDLWAVNTDGTDLERITIHAGIRWLSDVLARRSASDLRLQPRHRRRQDRHQSFSRALAGRASTSGRPQPPSD
jgi:Tol biopolymer transport system component